MPRRDPEPLLRTSYFQVLIDDRELGFAELQALVCRLAEKLQGEFPGAAVWASRAERDPAAVL